ncbi:acetoacetate decarboxylase family protein [Microbacterium sp. A84]|uniref:acetoacetate decarboxylase family protein n=1 Tax=Microbacterium sp. A84 TaxID=3450715 RepID=UPI003F43E9D5
MALNGWSLPLSPTGKASLVPAPPWHFSGTAIGIEFRADPAAIAAVLPAEIEPLPDGSACFTFVDWASTAPNDPRYGDNPARAQYSEAYISVFGTLAGKKVARVPYIWVDDDLSFARGLIQGFPKKMGQIDITRTVKVGQGGPQLTAGARLVGTVASLGTRLARGAVTLTGPEKAGLVPQALRMPVWHTRHVPDLAGGPPLVHDLARNLVEGFEVADVWSGDAELELFDSAFEEHTLLEPREIVGGFRCEVAFTIVGAEAFAG